jgi:hypothetical protein
VDGEGNFFVNNLPLKSGNNIVTLTINQFGVAQYNETRTINATTLQDIVLGINPGEGVISAVFAFTVTQYGARVLDRVELSWSAGATPDLVIPSSSFTRGRATASINIDSAGEFTINAKAYDVASPNVPFYSGQIKARATESRNLAVRIKSVLEQFRARLAAGDATGASQFFVEGVRNYYQTRLTALSSNLPAIAAALANPVSYSISENTARVIVVQTVGTEKVVTELNFTRDADGVWRIQSM